MEYWVILQRTEKFKIPETILFSKASALSDVLKPWGLTKGHYSLFSGLQNTYQLSIQVEESSFKRQLCGFDHHSIIPSFHYSMKKI